EVDIFIGGFPCTPYSFCNPKRFKRNCFTEPAAAPFFEMRKFIAARRPRMVILENVRGLLAPNPETKDTPMDFILRGKNPEDPQHCYQGTEPGAQWGLSLIEGYGLHWDLLYSCDWGLPQRRPRVYIVMVREDAGGQEAADRIFKVLHACAGHLPCGSCNDFLYPEDHPRLNKALQLAQGASSSERKACTPFTEALFKATRQEHGLDASERPYTKKRPKGWYPEATEKMVQQLDIIHALAEKRALDFKFLLADLSQQVSRGCWRDDGYVPTLTTAGSLYSFHHHRPIVGEECLKLNGFPVEELDLEGFTDNELKLLA
ncbi:CHT1, partial [Symbiodinium sp. KB8]